MDPALQIDMLSELPLGEVAAVVVVCQVLGLHNRIKAFLFQGTMLAPHPQPRGLGSTLAGSPTLGLSTHMYPANTVPASMNDTCLWRLGDTATAHRWWQRW